MVTRPITLLSILLAVVLLVVVLVRPAPGQAPVYPAIFWRPARASTFPRCTRRRAWRQRVPSSIAWTPTSVVGRSRTLSSVISCSWSSTLES